MKQHRRIEKYSKYLGKFSILIRNSYYFYAVLYTYIQKQKQATPGTPHQHKKQRAQDKNHCSYLQDQHSFQNLKLGPLVACASTVRRSIKHEWPLVITHSFHVTILAQRRRMEALKLKICHHLNCESHIHLGVLHKANAKSEHIFGRFTEFNILQPRECETSAAP